MAQTTEAACLLQTGALYTRRIGLRGPAGDLVFVGIKRGAVSLYFDDEPIYHFDLEGRWQRAFLAGIHYRKALDNSVVAIDRVREGPNLVLKRRTLRFDEATDLDEALRQVAIDLMERIGSGRLELVSPPATIRPLDLDELREVFDRISRWNASAWFSHRERYLAAYAPFGFLPPDAHQSVVLQATLGDLHPSGSEEEESTSRTPNEFKSHAQAVAKLLGKRILQNNGIFLGGDVLQRPMEQLLAYFDVISEVFPIRDATGPVHISDRPEDAPSLGGVDVYLDDFRPDLPECPGLEVLKLKGLRRINLGIGSGEADLRGVAGRGWNNKELVRFVSEARRAGVALGLIVFVGTGGRSWADRHIESTAILLNELDLGRGDLVYLIDVAETGLETLDGGEPLSVEETIAQTKTLRGRLDLVRAKGVKVAPYSLEKQWN